MLIIVHNVWIHPESINMFEYLKMIHMFSNCNLPWIATSTVFRANVIKIEISYLDNVGSKHCTSGNPWYNFILSLKSYSG